MLWFPLSAVLFLVLAVIHIFSGRRAYTVEAFFSLLLVLAGLGHLPGFSWLRYSYFPAVVVMAAFYRPRAVVPLAALIPLLEFSEFIGMEDLIGRSSFFGFLVAAALIASLVFSRLRKDRETALSSLQTLRDNARSVFREPGMDSLSSDKIMTNYLASMLKTDEEIRGLLLSIREATVADAASFFVPQAKGIVLRCSTEEKGTITTTGGGLISACLQGKKPLSARDINEKKLEPGYFKKDARISSIFAAPVMDGPTPIGVLAIDSARFQAFSEPEKKTVTTFAGHLVSIMERERIYPRIQRDYNGLKILNEESSKLVATLNSDVIIEKLCDGARKIASSDVYFFLSSGSQFTLVHTAGGMPAEKREYDLAGTFINMAVENKQQIYMSDVTGYRLPITPFKTAEVRSVLVVPLLYEDTLLGLFTMLSGEQDFADTFQVELIRVMCNQAATSIANAKLHAEIEKLATTDGLTGLFNHRTFQERLSEELKRLNRFSAPLSLLLTDIDFFKKVNDTHGHPVGDLVLKGVSKLIRETVRDIDIPARYGGEEFAAILPGTDSEGALKIAERIRKTVMNTPFSSDTATFKVTLSIGIATSPHDAKTKEELIEKTDQALYHAKHHGRNQCVPWSSIR